MNEERIIKLLNDEEFLKELVKKVDEKEVQELFASRGEYLNLSDIRKVEEKISEAVKSKSNALDMDVLNEISGGISAKNWFKTCLYSQVCSLEKNEKGEYDWNLDVSKIFRAVKSSIKGVIVKKQIQSYMK